VPGEQDIAPRWNENIFPEHKSLSRQILFWGAGVIPLAVVLGLGLAVPAVGQRENCNISAPPRRI
jgi:hypothetical protein